MTSPKRLAALGGGAPVYVEDVFSTYLYTGNGSIQTINNGIALGSSYGGSVYFDGTSDRITTPATGQFAPAGDFTVAWFYYPVTLQTTAMIANYTGNNTTDWSFETNATGQFLVYLNGSTVRITGGAGTVVANTWNYFVVSRSGTTVTAYRNGTTIGTFTLSGTFGSASKSIRIGAGSAGTNNMFGYCSNVILIDGTALTGAIPTAPFTPVTGTMLLTCQSPSPTTDYSPNAFTLTVTDAIAQNGGGPFTDSSANKGGMVWLKGRSGATDHALYDTNRGATFDLVSNSTVAQTTQTTGLTAFNSNGFSIGALAKLNTNAATYASWTFRKQAKFFDVVTYTGNGTTQNIAHNLGSVPGTIFVKRTNLTAGWRVYHRSLSNTQNLVLNTTGAVSTSATIWNSTTPTSTVFSVGADTNVNASGGTYVAYLFAHDSGGFGPTGSDNVISCGSYTGNGGSTGPVVTLGYEPQWILIKNVDTFSDWFLVDVARGWTITAVVSLLDANTSDAESTPVMQINVLPTGFQPNGSSSAANNANNYIYIAIRRGPMKTPTSGTSVFAMDTFRATNPAYQSNFPVDMFFNRFKSSTGGWDQGTRLLGNKYLVFNTAAAEINATDYFFDYQNGVRSTAGTAYPDFQGWMFRRAPGFFDVVCDTGTGVAKTVTHNLTVVPELMIRKKRNSASNSEWTVWHSSFSGTTKFLVLNATDAEGQQSNLWTTTPPTASVFTVGTGARINNNNDTFVTYLFASIAGVSKIGNYTGNGSSQTIDCGFAAGARFILIKRTSSTGDWYVWDTARGIVSGNDPRMSLNSTAAQVTTDDSIDPDSSGFIVNQLAATNINVNAATYIFLAIA